MIEDCLHEALNYARERRQHGKLIGKHQLVQDHLAHIEIARQATEAIVMQAAAAKAASSQEPGNSELHERADLLVDGIVSFVGTANWDARSLRLNFEFNLECYDRELATTLTELVRAKIQDARPVSLADVDGRSLPIRLRDGIARLCSPYL